MSRCDSSSMAPTGTVTAASACQPSMMAPQSIDTMSPSSSTPVAGDAVHDHLVRRDAGDGGEPVVAEEVGPGAAAVEHLACGGSRSAVVAPGFAAAVHSSCISATTRPARRMRAIWAGVLRRTIYVRVIAVPSIDFDDPFEDLVALADAVDHGRALPARGSSR